MNTATFGAASVTYPFTQVMQQLAHGEEEALPIAKEVLNQDFYVDDLLIEADTSVEALMLQAQIVELMGKGYFKFDRFFRNMKNKE